MQRSASSVAIRNGQAYGHRSQTTNHQRENPVYEDIERLTQFHGMLTANIIAIQHSNKKTGGYAATSEAVRAAESVATEISKALTTKVETLPI